MEILLTRRSHRSFTSEPLTDEQAEALLRAAMEAPSAKNTQPWEFVVVTERKLLDAITRVHPACKAIPTAALAILVCADPARDQGMGYWIQGCSAATQNILLAAHSMGLGAVWMGVYPKEDRMAGLASLFGLPEHIQPVALVAIGHPREQMSPGKRFDRNKVHYNGW